MQWNLHIVGEALQDELEDVLANLVADLERVGHRLTSAVLTTDAGQTPLATTPQPSGEAPDAPAEPGSTADSTAPSSATPSGPQPTDTPSSPLSEVGPTESTSQESDSSETTIAVTGPEVDDVKTDTPPTLGTTPASV